MWRVPVWRVAVGVVAVGVVAVGAVAVGAVAVGAVPVGAVPVGAVPMPLSIELPLQSRVADGTSKESCQKKRWRPQHRWPLSRESQTAVARLFEQLPKQQRRGRVRLEGR